VNSYLHNKQDKQKVITMKNDSIDNNQNKCSCRIRRRPNNNSCRRTRTMTTTTIAMVLTILQSNTMPSTDAFTSSPSIRTSSHYRASNTLLEAAAAGNQSNFFEQTTKANKPLHRLTHQQEVSYLQQMKSYPADSALSQLARETLLLHNLPLVQSIVTKVLRSRPHLQLGNTGSLSSPSESKVGAALTRDDLLHEGTIGLAEALDRYDLAYAYTEPNPQPSTDKALPKGARLGTYATYWIRARIVRAIQSREHVIRFPERVLQASHRLVKAAKELGMDWNDVVEMAESAADLSSLSSKRQQQRDALQQAAGISSEFLFREAVRVRSMSASSSHTPFESWMSAKQQEEEDLEEEEASPEQIRETLSKFLKPREVEVLSLRYGLISAEEDDEEVFFAEVENANAVACSSHQPVFRDYEAEAEEDLFGPNGILSHYSADTSKASSISTPAVAAKTTANKTTQETYLSVRSKATTSPSLVPFKEIGKKMKFSGEYCRRTCSAALNKLTRAAEEGRLAESDFLLGFQS